MARGRQQRFSGVMRIMLVAILLTGCTLLPSRGETVGAATPEAAVQHAVLDGTDLPPAVTQNFTIYGTRMWEHGALVLYNLPMPRTPDDPMIYYHFVERGAQGWHATFAKGFSTGMFHNQQAIAFRMDEVDVTSGRYQVLFGRVREPGVRVEVELTDHQRLRDTATGQLIILIMPQKADPRELRVLDQHGQVIERIDLSPQMSGG